MKPLFSISKSAILATTFAMMAASSLPMQAAGRAKSKAATRITTPKAMIDAARASILRRIDSVTTDGRNLTVYVNPTTIERIIRTETVDDAYQRIADAVPEDYRKQKLEVRVGSYELHNWIPLAYRSEQKGKPEGGVFKTKDVTPIVSRVGAPDVKHGLAGRHIAMWQSHGVYYEAKLDRWEWQRARIFQTVEDLYTQSYVLPFLVPMLERAGANVFMPRERDCNPIEVIVDADGGKASAQAYSENNGRSAWQQGEGTGFAWKREVYINHENPFADGTYRVVSTVRKADDESLARWTPNIPKTREYAVYVSYKTLPKSAEDALYTVHHAGGETQFRVNQTMGGGTWIYLGTFLFEQGSNAAKGSVTLSNVSAAKDGRAVVTADAVKFGGGMGNVGRYVDMATRDQNGFRPITNEQAIISEMPRFCEGARYWMQWAGVPDSIYDLTDGKNDYTDDYKNRGLWVNWLAGGTEVNPKEAGLGIPIDLSFAFHTDAGTTLNDDIIGTLSIFDTKAYGGKYANGSSRIRNREYADMVQTQICEDIRSTVAPEWNRRQLWDKTYFEGWMPKCPGMLLELLSHQNLADMRYGLDPRFRFLVSRAIYKGMLRFTAQQRGEAYVVQPLPVRAMNLRQTQANTVELTWLPTPDSLEATAMPTSYIIYTRRGHGGWDNGVTTTETRMTFNLTPGEIMSFRVEAMNDGGRSFPSETLSAGIPANYQANDGMALVVNGFNRISAPADFEAPGEGARKLAGLLDEEDHGVPYLADISYIGSMKNFDRSDPWHDDDASGFGDSYGNEERNVIAGNTFDYPIVHGEALLKAGQAFTSCSREAVENGTVRLADYKMVDLILGKQYQTLMGRKANQNLDFKTFTPAMQQKLTEYLRAEHGALMVSGAFVGSDLWNNRDVARDEADTKFATDVLKYFWRASRAAIEGRLKGVRSPNFTFNGRFGYSHTLNDACYIVESPDAIEPSVPEGFTAMRYAENNLSAAVAYPGADYRTFVMGVPFETLNTAAERETLMAQIVDFLLGHPVPLAQ